MTVIQRLTDGFQNIVANLGTARDKASFNSYVFTPADWQQLETVYRANPLARKVVDIPAEDAFREWREWQAEAKQITAIEGEEQRLNLRGALVTAMKAARLHGGAAIFIGTGEQNTAKPLNPERIGKGGISYLTVMGRHEINEGEIERDPREGGYGRPKSYTMASGAGGTLAIHPSRLVVLRGEELPCGVMRTDTWGDSTLDGVMESLSRMDATFANIASLVFEAKIDVIKIKNFTQDLRSGGTAYEQLMMRRFMLAATAKGVNGAMLLDSEEDYQQKSASFATLPDIADRFMQMVSAAADIPMTRLFGMSPAGMNATGESDQKNYHDRVKTIQTLGIDPAIEILNECLIRSALGSRPAEIFYNWRSLHQPTAKERADVGKVMAETMQIALGMDAVSVEAAGTALVNALTESGAFPGLEGAADEFPNGEDEDEFLTAPIIPEVEE